MAALAAVLADLSGNLSFFGISRPLNFRVFGRKTTLFQIAAIRPGGQHFVFPFRELNAAPLHSFALLCTPMHPCHRLSPTRHQMVCCSRPSPAEGENFECASTDSPKTREVPWPLSFPPVTKKKPPAT